MLSRDLYGGVSFDRLQMAGQELPLYYYYKQNNRTISFGWANIVGPSGQTRGYYFYVTPPYQLPVVTSNSALRAYGKH